MSERVVVPFRQRPPSEAEFEAYRQMTRDWHPDLRQLMFPEHFKLEASAPSRDRPRR